MLTSVAESWDVISDNHELALLLPNIFIPQLGIIGDEPFHQVRCSEGR